MLGCHHVLLSELGETLALDVRPAATADTERLVELFNGYRTFYGRTNGGGAAFMRERLRRGDSRIWVAVADRTVVGFVQVYEQHSSLELQHTWVLNDLFVDPAVRGTGAGRALVRTVVSEATENGVDAVHLETQVENTGAQSLYESEGFDRLHEDGGFLYYRKQLPSPRKSPTTDPASSVRRRLSVLDAPSNLGLRPPARDAVPGSYKLPGALRDHGLLARLGAEDAGCAVPPRYAWKWPSEGVVNADGIAHYAQELAERITALQSADRFPIVLGGDCSILIGAGLAAARRGRCGLVLIDGHSDFRHPGNVATVGAAAGEDLALVTGRGQSDLTDLGSCGPYFRDDDVVVFGIRSNDDHLAELGDTKFTYWTVDDLRAAGVDSSLDRALALVESVDLDGFWIHLDVDVLDAEIMPAADSPDPGGLTHAELRTILSRLAASDRCFGLEVTVFDPDLDPDRQLARELVQTIVDALGPGTTA